MLRLFKTWLILSFVITQRFITPKLIKIFYKDRKAYSEICWVIWEFQGGQVACRFTPDSHYFNGNIIRFHDGNIQKSIIRSRKFWGNVHQLRCVILDVTCALYWTFPNVDLWWSGFSALHHCNNVYTRRGNWLIR